MSQEETLNPIVVQNALSGMYRIAKELDPDYVLEFMEQIQRVEKSRAVQSNIRYVRAIREFVRVCDEIRTDAVRELGDEDKFQEQSVNRLRADTEDGPEDKPDSEQHGSLHRPIGEC